MKKILSLLTVCAVSFSLSAITLEKKEKSWTVSNDHYRLIVEKNQGFRIRISTLNGKNIPRGFIVLRTAMNNEREKWNGTSSRDVAQYVSRTAGASGKILSESKDKVVMEISMETSHGKIKETVTFDNSPLIRYDIAVDHTNRLGFHSIYLNFANTNSDGVLHYPDMKMIRGTWGANGNAVDEPTWRYVWYGKDKIGLGVVAVPHKNFGQIAYSLERKQDEWREDQATMTVTHAPLGDNGLKGSFRFQYNVIAGGTPEKAKEIAESILGKDSSIKFFTYETEKLVIRPGDSNKMLCDLRNTTGKAAEVTLKTTINYDLNTSKVVDTRKVNLAAGEFKNVVIPVVFPKEVQRGVSIRTDVLDSNGKVLDSKFDICTITDFLPRDAGFAIMGVSQAHQEGAQDSWNNIFKKNYIGAYEYYCWPPSTIFGLAPKEDQWYPGSEHNYRNIVTKKYIQGLVKNAHTKGVGVYAWISGLWNYKKAMTKPEWVTYTSEGYPNMFSGMMYPDGDRRVVVKPNMYYPDRARIWAEEMADSVDMFGWDGCRWDWGFTPSSSNDPLYQDRKMDPWYDLNGTPSHKLFPDPDKTGVECLNAWREVMKKRHPNFIYGTNYNSSPVSRRLYPGYQEASAKNALVLFEDMNGYAREPYSTFEKWGKELAIRCDRVRCYNAAPVVGAMYGLPYYSVSYHLANYTCASAGVKWWTYAGISKMSRVQERNRYFMRFAEWYFETSYRLPETCPVDLAENVNVLYKPFTRERKTADGREVVVPLVNMPEENWYICEYHKELPVRTVPLKLNLKPGETIKEVWLMTPQDPEKAVKLEVKDGIAKVPALKDAAMVLFRCKGGK